MATKSALRFHHDVEDELFLEVLQKTGSFEMKVKGGSMTPTILQGDTVALLFIPEDQRLNISLGEIVLRKNGEQFILHRVVGIRAQPRQLLTKGDGLAGPDCWSSPQGFFARVKTATTPAGQSFAIGERVFGSSEKLRLRWRRFRR
ncbi:MAG: hypothetical protein GY822_16585 [Deltaproteobacteria bacterium]|nr:hypothetical protein [Deltaproteobacteria bacterium]